MSFVLHPRLVTATAPVGDLPLSRVLLLDDRRYPWLLVVPRRMGVEEIVDLASADRAQLMEEIALLSSVLQDTFSPFRLNIADIGNKAEQLHIHIVARNPGDEAWPAVVWSRALARYGDDEARAAMRQRILAPLAGRTDFVELTRHTDPGVARL